MLFGDIVSRDIEGNVICFVKNSSSDKRLSKSRGFEHPTFTKKAGSMPLSGQALLELLQAVLDKGAQFRFCAKGHSMDPFIQDGDIITISLLSGVLPRLGDIMAFVHPEKRKLIVHRVIRKMDGSFLTCGDGMRHNDGVVPVENILGYVTKVERNGKEVLFCLGPERLLIAFLSRRKILVPLWSMVRKFLRPTPEDNGS